MLVKKKMMEREQILRIIAEKGEQKKRGFLERQIL